MDERLRAIDCHPMSWRPSDMKHAEGVVQVADQGTVEVEQMLKDFKSQ
jgi:hypothetical protein